MSAGQPNQELTALVERVRAQLRACNIEEVIVVDDRLDTDLTEVRWIEAVGRLRTDDTVGYENLRKLIREAGKGKVEELPPDDILDEAVRLIRASASRGAEAILTEVRFQETALEFLIAMLREVGLNPICRARVTAEDFLRKGKLYFLDYRMQGNNETAGLDASQLLSEIVNQRPAEAPPPAAVLMSRGKDEHPTQAEWELVAKRAGYYRFNFRYLGKEKLEGGKMPFLFFLHELLASLPLGREYYKQLRGLRKAAEAAADAALEKIRQLTPAEFSMFAGRHLGDGSGRKASRHVLDLFLGLLDAEVKDNAELEASFRAFAAMLRSSPMLASTDEDIHTLNQLHNQLLYDRSRWVLSGPVEFGDIYHRAIEPDVYYLVLTPECDLDLRYKNNRWAPKAGEILLLRGEVKHKHPDKNKQENVIGKPFVSEGAARWIWWYLRKFVLIPAQDLALQELEQVAGWPQLIGDTGLPVYGCNEGRYLKWGHLRHVEAEQIQQEFVSDFASVGTDEVSGKIKLHSVEVWHRQQGQPDCQLGKLVIVETPIPNDEDSPYWAFGDGCEPMLCAEALNDVVLPLLDLLELRKSQPKKAFIDKCRKKNLHVLERDSLLLVRSQRPVPGTWKPPAPAHPAEPEAQAEPEAAPKQDSEGDLGQHAARSALAEAPPTAESKDSDPAPKTDAGGQ